MAEQSYLWTTSGTPSGDQVASYTQAHWATIVAIAAACSHYEGVAPDRLNEFSITFPSTETARIASGWATVDGKPYENDANNDISVPAASGAGNTRIDRIVLRADWSAFTVRLTRIAGTDAASPSPPAITQSSGTTYDVTLYQVLVDTAGTVTEQLDERVWAAPEVDDATVEVDQGTGRLQVKDGGVDTAQLALAAVTAAKIAAGAVDTSELAADAVTNANMANNAVDTAELVDAAVTLAKLAADSVDDTKAGDRMPQFYRRQGGDASDWSVKGTTNRTPSAVRMQAGSLAVAAGGTTLTFPVAFSNPPVVLVAVTDPTGAVVKVSSVTASTCVIEAVFVDNTPVACDVFWLAIGPE